MFWFLAWKTVYSINGSIDDIIRKPQLGIIYVYILIYTYIYRNAIQ